MNILPGAQSMRIIALPLAKIKKPSEHKIKSQSGSSAHTMLVFYHFDLVSPYGGSDGTSWHRRVLKSTVDKATDLWTNLGKAPKGGWKSWTYQLGERIINKTEFEELALGTVEPSLGPTIPQTETSHRVHGVESQSRSVTKIPLIYPPSLYPPGPADGANHAFPPPLAHLQALLGSREPQHRWGFYLWMLAIPLTFPITLIPLIPNFPLFFCAWRSWSHYRAYRSSQYLSSMLKHGLIEPKPSLELDKLYMPSSRPSGKESTVKHTAAGRELGGQPGIGATRSDRILLTPEAVPQIFHFCRLPESAIVNMHRAMSQVRSRLGDLS